MAVVDVGQRPETVELHLEEEVGVVEGCGELDEVHRGHLGQPAHRSVPKLSHSSTRQFCPSNPYIITPETPVEGSRTSTSQLSALPAR